MNREHHKWYSQSLGRDMELLVYGHAGTPVLVFPTSQGRFFEYEDRGMTHALGDKLENGALQLFSVDSVDSESWYNRGVHPIVRVARHGQYEQYLLQEILPFIAQKNPDRNLVTTGCSFGGYHAMNFALRHPDLVKKSVVMGAAYDMQQFLDGYYDTDLYLLTAPHFLPNLTDPWFLDRIVRNKWVFATGERDMCRAENERIASIFAAKQIPHSLHVWGDGAGHDWPEWRRMASAYLP